MTSKEKQVCIECGDYKNCPYVSRNLEHKCQHLSDIMYGFELGYKDAIDEACAFIENIKSHDYDYLKSYGWEGVYWEKIKTTELAKDLRKHMEEQK